MSTVLKAKQVYQQGKVSLVQNSSNSSVSSVNFFRSLEKVGGEGFPNSYWNIG